MNNRIPLSVLMENAKAELTQTFNQILDTSQLPAYLMEGVILDLLAEVRRQKNLELISDLNHMNKQNLQKGNT